MGGAAYLPTPLMGLRKDASKKYVHFGFVNLRSLENGKPAGAEAVVQSVGLPDYGHDIIATGYTAAPE